MRAALAEAELAGAQGEVPIGAVAVVGEQIVARAHNRREADGNPLGHAEILLLQQLIGTRASWRLDDVTLYVTCEPCLMCAGALLQARLARLVYGCADPKAGACGSLYQVLDDARLNHRIPCTAGVLAADCGALLSAFFRGLRGCKSVKA
ncbi:MAG: nucleoside deaminase [Deltaproteobacteria bacterium]|nr:nucleoside deaminase [Deltaproteobacteria bacterium]